MTISFYFYIDQGSLPKLFFLIVTYCTFIFLYEVFVLTYQVLFLKTYDSFA